MQVVNPAPYQQHDSETQAIRQSTPANKVNISCRSLGLRWD